MNDPDFGINVGPNYTEEELACICKMFQNLMGACVEGGIEPGIVESIYTKTTEHLN